MTRTQEGSRIRVAIAILDEDGEIVEESLPEEPVELEIGDGTLPPTVETALIGLEAGAKIEVTCPEGEAFAKADPEAIVSVPREEFPEDVELVKGGLVSIAVEDEDGEIDEMAALIVEVNADGVILDANHPLAGKEATFRVEVLGIE